jgi:hypothetical protein
LSMAREALVDSSGLHPLADHLDPSWKRAVRIVPKFVLMKELGIQQALATGWHFLIAGIEPLLPVTEP